MPTEIFVVVVVMVQSARVMGSRRDAESTTRLLICHACHAFLGLLSAQACSLFNCEIGIARAMLHFHCQDSSHDGAQGKGD